MTCATCGPARAGSIGTTEVGDAVSAGSGDGELSVPSAAMGGVAVGVALGKPTSVGVAARVSVGAGEATELSVANAVGVSVAKAVAGTTSVGVSCGSGGVEVSAGVWAASGVSVGVALSP